MEGNGRSSVEEVVDMALPGLRWKSRLPFVAYRISVPTLEFVKRNDMVVESEGVLCGTEEM